MNPTFYLQRALLGSERSYEETELVVASKHIVVLAEPGAGKTRLLISLANQLDTKCVRANVFLNTDIGKPSECVVVDAVDEIVKIDRSAIDRLLGKIHNLSPNAIIISSRSSEWSDASTRRFADYFGVPPLVLRLTPFTPTEQHAIFDNRAPGESFSDFRKEIERFDLDALLPNPQFLLMFADAYVEANRKFSNKHSIYELAIERLAKEHNESSIADSTTTYETRIRLAQEVMAKLLLAGSEGVSTSDASDNRMYPRLETLVDEERVREILGTQLFRPGDSADLHSPTHKIIAEYCGAKYLIARLTSNTRPLDLSQLLAIIAPNSVVRDELRGLLGWLAALGNKEIQEAAISLDPYAVLANGDPSRLITSSKKHLLHKLKETTESDPFFRRSDKWRVFNASTFFTIDLAAELRKLLSDNEDLEQLRGLILELLVGSPASYTLAHDLQMLTLSASESESTRVFALRCLLALPNYDYLADLDVLIAERSNVSLTSAVGIIKKIGPDSIQFSLLVDCFHGFASLNPGRKQWAGNTHISSYFLKGFVDTLEFKFIRSLLDELTREIVCTCNLEHFECECRIGISKVVGLLLDRYFELYSGPFEPSTIWAWIRNLVFENHARADKSASVRVLQSDNELRQGIISLALKGVSSKEQIHEINLRHFNFDAHSGLSLQPSDGFFVVDLAFDTNNVDLWEYYFVPHQLHQNNSISGGPNPLRQHMRLQAKQKPEFQRAWATRNRISNEYQKKYAPILKSSQKRRKKKRIAKIARENQEALQENYELVNSGQHWGFLRLFAQNMLMGGERPNLYDETIEQNALCNCLDFIESRIPSMMEFAELQCKSQTHFTEPVLFAACLSVYRASGNLEGVSPKLLSALRTNLRMGYRGISSEEQMAIKIETDRILFPTADHSEGFLRAYIEPQFDMPNCSNTEIEWLRNDEAFIDQRSTLPLEWLERYKILNTNTMAELFDLSVEYGDREELVKLIRNRVDCILSKSSNELKGEKINEERRFWFIRAFYFLKDAPTECWNWLKEDEDTLPFLNRHSGNMNYVDNKAWPRLSATMVEAILDAFIEKWPKIELPNNWGTESPENEKAYRFLRDVVWELEKDEPDIAIAVIDRLLSDRRYMDFYPVLKSIRSFQVRNKAHREFAAPNPKEIVSFLKSGEITTVEVLRAFLLKELQQYQKDLDGSDITSRDIFYNCYPEKDRIGEIPAAKRIADRLRLRLEPYGVVVNLEHQLRDEKRCDITFNKMIGSKRKLLVTEVKGQWNRDLFNAAEEQLNERYMIHPDAEQQGIYLVIWFGAWEKVAGRIHEITNPQKLKASIESKMDSELRGQIDIFVLDVS